MAAVQETKAKYSYPQLTTLGKEHVNNVLLYTENYKFNLQNNISQTRGSILKNNYFEFNLLK